MVEAHDVERWTVPAATFKLCAPDETAARLMATRAAHRRAGVPPMKPLLRESWPHTSATAIGVAGLDARLEFAEWWPML